MHIRGGRDSIRADTHCLGTLFGQFPAQMDHLGTSVRSNKGVKMVPWRTDECIKLFWLARSYTQTPARTVVDCASGYGGNNFTCVGKLTELLICFLNVSFRIHGLLVQRVTCRWWLGIAIFKKGNSVAITLFFTISRNRKSPRLSNLERHFLLIGFRCKVEKEKYGKAKNTGKRCNLFTEQPFVSTIIKLFC